MPLDAVFLTALKNELSEQVIGTRIDKVQQPERDMLLLSLRGLTAFRVLISAGTGNARIHLTGENFENPQSPPMFCMLLRKHLIGAKISSLIQPPMERMVDITLDTRDSMGVPSEKHLILELMGRYSNIILTEGDGLIIDCLRRVDAEMSEKRQVLPGLLYRLPPLQDKFILSETNPKEMKRMLRAAPPEQEAAKWLMDTFTGLSPLISRELVYGAYRDRAGRIFEMQREDGGAALLDVLNALSEKIKRAEYAPFIIADSEGKPRDFTYMPIFQYGNTMTPQKAESFSALLEDFYTRRDKAERVRQRASAIHKTVKNARDRAARKLALQQEELKATQNRSRLKEIGDILTANLHVMKRGMTALRAVDFYSERGDEIEITLDPLKTPQQNAAKYYKDYAKAKTAEKFLTEQISLGENELVYLESVLEELNIAEGERDLGEIRQELIDTGYLRQQKGGKKEKRAESKPMRFLSSTGMEIWVGKNNSQNDKLTLKTAFKNDVWLHTQKIHGSHVIISAGGVTPDEKTLGEAAMLAAYYSKARNDSKVPVDHTLVKNVKKPPGSHPGMVTYNEYKTIYVNPSEEIVNRLRA